jgi:hypothetical protein
MRSIVALGVVSLAVAAGMVACGDDSSDDGPSLGGSGGTSGGGSGGGGAGGAPGGTGGGGTGGTSGGTGGTGGAGPGPNTDPLATCTGCVELITPLTGPNDNSGTTNLADQVGYQFAAPAGTVIDMSDAVITWRIAAVAPNANTSVTLYAQNGMPQGYAGAYQFVALDPTAFTANTFRDISIDLSAVAAAPGDAGAPPAEEPDAGGDGGVSGPVPTIVGAFDKAQITQFGITLGVSAAFTGSTVVRVAVDQVTIVGVPGQANRTFTAGAEGLAINQYQIPPGTREPVHHP